MKIPIYATLYLIIMMTMLTMETTAASNRVESKQATELKTDYIVLGMGCFWGAEKRSA